MTERNLTFIIPYKKDCKDRETNLITVTHYLLHNFEADVIILEADEKESISSILPDDERLTTLFVPLKKGEVFHRTKYLNMMLERVKTPVVANYDVDVLLDPRAVEEATNSILNDKMDVVYPYESPFDGEDKVYANVGQVRLFLPFDHDTVMSKKLYEHPAKIIEEMKNILGEKCILTPEEAKKNTTNQMFLYDEDGWTFTGYAPWSTLAGHCQFVNTKKYFEYFMENEEFVGWGPEDAERLKRFIHLGARISYLSGSVVYHMEHRHPHESGKGNKYYKKNESLWKEFQEIAGIEKYREKYLSWNYYEKYNHEWNPYKKAIVEHE